MRDVEIKRRGNSLKVPIINAVAGTSDILPAPL